MLHNKITESKVTESTRRKIFDFIVLEPIPWAGRM